LIEISQLLRIYFLFFKSLSKGADCATLTVCRLEPEVSMKDLSRKFARQAGWAALILIVSGTLAAWPAAAQGPRAAITAPVDGQEVRGVVSITGSANHPEFNRYELAISPDPNPNDAWQVFNTTNLPVDNNVLGLWDTSTAADGTWALRLRVVRKDSNYDEVVVRGLRVSNLGPASTPTPLASETTPTPTVDSPGVEPALRTIPTVLVEQPPTSLPAAVAPGALPTPDRPGTRSSGAAALVDLSLITTTCLSGAIVAGFVFALLGVIQLGRVQYKQLLRLKYKKSHRHADSQSASPPGHAR
jgi:hypothetical protein